MIAAIRMALILITAAIVGALIVAIGVTAAGWYLNGIGAPTLLVHSLARWHAVGEWPDWHAIWSAPPTIFWWGQVRAVLRAAGIIGASFGLLYLLIAAPFIIRAHSRAREAARWALVNSTREPGPQLTIADVPLPRKSEARGILLSGAPGTGKTQVIIGLLRAARARGDSVIAVDRGGELMSKFAQRGDYILCPPDARSRTYSLLADARTDMQIASVCELLLPRVPGGGAEDYFHAAAAVVLSSVLRSHPRNNHELWHILSQADAISAVLKNTEADQYRTAREWGGIYSTLINAVRWLKMLPPEAGPVGVFSVRNFISYTERAEGRGRALWVVIPKASATALAPLAALIVGIAAEAGLSLPPSDSRRLWITTDELGSLPRLSRWDTVLAEGRKHGLCPISGIQSIAQLRRAYGRDGAQALMACYQTWLILRAGDAETAEAMSQHVGSKEIREWTEGESHDAETRFGTGTHSRTEHVRVKRAVLAREIMELPDLKGYLSVAPFAPALVTVPIVNLATVINPFVPIPNVSALAPSAAQESAPASQRATSESALVSTQPTLPPALQLGALDSVSAESSVSRK